MTPESPTPSHQLRLQDPEAEVLIADLPAVAHPPVPQRTERVSPPAATRALVLNRPRAINALTPLMVDLLSEAVSASAADRTPVVLTGAGTRGFCSGADVRALRAGLISDDPAGRGQVEQFFEREYALDSAIGHHPDVTALMDGVCMGGGLGLSAHARARYVTDRSRIAMPETLIGLFPDVGVLYELSRAPGEIGTHLALTGATISGADAVYAGLADQVLASSEVTSLTWAEGSAPWIPADSAERSEPRTASTSVSDGHEGDVAEPNTLAEPNALADDREWIDECYAGDDAVGILARLRASSHPRARAAGEELAVRSPFAVHVTLAAIRRARELDLDGVLAQDTRIVARVIERPDFAEGVRARLVDKDQQPRWEHADLTDVPAELVEAVFRG